MSVLVLLAVLPVKAGADGGKSIATAPTVVYGQQQVGNTATDQHLEDSCFLGFYDIYVSYWLVNLIAGDQLAIDFEGVAGTELHLLPTGTTDFTLVDTSSVADEEVSTNGKAHLTYTAPTSAVMPLDFSVCEQDGPPGPYAFTASVRHALFAALVPTVNVYRQSAIGGSATLADGTPAPDGTVFNLVAKWHVGREVLRSVTSATTAGGGLAFQLNLPPETVGKKVRLAITRGEDGSYQAAKSAPVNVQVAAGGQRKAKKHCRKGFRKKRVDGKTKCVRKQRGHRR